MVTYDVALLVPAQPSKPGSRLPAVRIDTPYSHVPSRWPSRIEAALPEHQENGLKGVLGVVSVVHDGHANAQDHRTMPGD